MRTYQVLSPLEKIVQSFIGNSDNIDMEWSIMSYNLLDESDLDFQTKKTNSPQFAYILSILQKWKDRGHTSWQMLIEQLKICIKRMWASVFSLGLVGNRKVENIRSC